METNNPAQQFAQQLQDWKQSQNPVFVTFIKKEFDTLLVKEDNGAIHRVNKNRIWANMPAGALEPGDLLEVRREDMNGDYLKK